MKLKREAWVDVDGPNCGACDFLAKAESVVIADMKCDFYGVYLKTLEKDKFKRCEKCIGDDIDKKNTIEKLLLEVGNEH